MSGIFIEKLSFESTDLGIDLDLLLTFDDHPVAGLYKTYYPSVFAVRKFGAENAFFSDVVFRSQLAFTKTEVSDEHVIQGASASVLINAGQSTTLTKQDDVYSFSEPQYESSVPKANIQCTINAPSKEDIGVGFVEKEGKDPKTALVWRGVGDQERLNVQFTPTLRGYIGTNYKENSLIKDQIETNRLFEENLAHLEENTSWVITYDHASGSFSIDRK